MADGGALIRGWSERADAAVSALPGRPLLLQVLLAPERCRDLSLRQWDLLVRQAVRCDLLARLARGIEAAGLGDAVPDPAMRHLRAASVFAAKHVRDVAHELTMIHEALAPVGVPVLLLKGAAYREALVPHARTRLFGDVDLLVPRAALREVEAALFARGWVSSSLDAYDQNYYREFMHELPPMVHALRGTTVDIHHTIIPPTSTGRVDPQALFRHASDTAGPFKVLGPLDMVLHSATHLFHEGDLEHGFRDLIDLADLLSHLDGGDRDAFVAALRRRADAFDLRVPLDHALHYLNLLLAQDAPRSTGWQRGIMDALFRRALAPWHESCEDRFTTLARFALYIRGHYLRMPPRLLLPHLLRKSRKRLLTPAP